MSYSSPEVLDSDDSAESSTSESQFDEWKEDLYDSLQGIKAAGDIANFARYPTFANPGLKIEGHPAIPLPLTPSDAEILKSACRQAPFGKGEDTIVDTSVRKTWELDHTQFELLNPEWEGFLMKLGLGAASGLGLTDVLIKRYKLLLYEPGSFFKRHKDSEKEPGMVGTLVVCLPSEHEGGDVHISFGADHRSFSTASYSKFDLTTLAWYSDVSHEVKELSSGYRLALVYNMVQNSGDKRSAGFWGRQAEGIKTLLCRWEKRFSEENLVIYPLDHKYSESSVSLKNMKGRDKAAIRPFVRF